jgi:hypothetical protein
MGTVPPELTRRLHTAAADAGAEDLAVVITQLERPGRADPKPLLRRPLAFTGTPEGKCFGAPRTL